MINLVKMNLYRLFTMKLSYILWIVAFVIIGFVTMVESDPMQQELDRQLIEESGVTEEELNSEMGMTIQSEGYVEKTYDQIVAESVKFGIALILVGIFAVRFSHDEREDGYLKNLTVGRRHQGSIFASKIPAVFLFSLICLIMVAVGVYVGRVIAQAGLGMQSTTQLIYYLFVQTMLHTAFGAFVMVTYELLRNIVVSTLCAVLGSFGVFVVIFGTLESKLAMLSEKFIDLFGLSQYMIVSRSRNLELGVCVFPHVPSIVVGIIGLLFYSILGVFLLRKRDIL